MKELGLFFSAKPGLLEILPLVSAHPRFQPLKQLLPAVEHHLSFALESFASGFNILQPQDLCLTGPRASRGSMYVGSLLSDVFHNHHRY